MINELFSKAKSLFTNEFVLSTNAYNRSDIGQIKADLRLLHPKQDNKASNHRCQQQMEALYIDYFCRDFEAEERIYTPEHYHHTLFQDLKSPTYRVSLTQQLPHAISRLLYASRHHLNNEESSQTLLLCPLIKREALHLANMAPFAQENLLENFADMKNKMGHAEFLAVICTAVLKQHCISANTSILEKQLFEDGLRNAYICLCLAQKDDEDGVSAFISGYMHFISLIYLHRELLAYEIAPPKTILLAEITEFFPKFTYWLAKDWGLPDNVLSALRARFIDKQELSGLSAIIQTADHSNLTLMLCKEKLISAKQTQQFIHAMGLSEFNLSEQLFSTQH